MPFTVLRQAQADAPLLPKVPPGTVLTIGDPVTQKALEVSGLGKELSFEVKWANNISGGPQTSGAFRAHALDVGSMAEIPSMWGKCQYNEGENFNMISVKLLIASR